MSNVIKILLGKSNYDVLLVDAEDVHLLANYRCVADRRSTTTYVRCVSRGERGPGRFSLHNLIMNPPEGMIVDHKNHDGLDNRRANLRVVNKQQNTWNKRKMRGETSCVYKGVSRYKDARHYPWLAFIRSPESGRRIHLGSFTNPEAAAVAYDEAARRLHGEHACLNFPKKIRSRDV